MERDPDGIARKRQKVKERIDLERLFQGTILSGGHIPQERQVPIGVPRISRQLVTGQNVNTKTSFATAASCSADAFPRVPQIFASQCSGASVFPGLPVGVSTTSHPVPTSLPYVVISSSDHNYSLATPPLKSVIPSIMPQMKSDSKSAPSPGMHQMMSNSESMQSSTMHQMRAISESAPSPLMHHRTTASKSASSTSMHQMMPTSESMPSSTLCQMMPISESGPSPIMHHTMTASKSATSPAMQHMMNIPESIPSPVMHDMIPTSELTTSPVMYQIISASESSNQENAQDEIDDTIMKFDSLELDTIDMEQNFSISLFEDHPLTFPEYAYQDQSGLNS